MKIILSQASIVPENTNFAIITDKAKLVSTKLLTKTEKIFVEKEKANNPQRDIIPIQRPNQLVVVLVIDNSSKAANVIEKCRKIGGSLSEILSICKTKEFVITSLIADFKLLAALAEGIALASYSFTSWFSDKKQKENSHPLQSILILHKNYNHHLIKSLETAVDGVFLTRDLVNEPPSAKSGVLLANKIRNIAEPHGIRCEIMEKKKIEALKMGGILAVNRGSVDPPAFMTMEWEPKGKLNQKPLVIIGKGVTFDTGGMNLKTGPFMDGMKSDMAGAATVASVIISSARLNIPLHIIVLLPFTDNRVDGNALLPGDVIVMHNGTTVEVNNTDAEGRLILADAISYANRLDPVMIITAATLTGSAMRAIGEYGTVAMQSKAEKEMTILKNAGEDVFERIVEFPMWEEYGNLLKSDIADLSNIGGINGGASVAAKFLEHFTTFPFIHLDMAGTAFADKKSNYITKGGTGTGVRLLLNFLDKYKMLFTD